MIGRHSTALHVGGGEASPGYSRKLETCPEIYEAEAKPALDEALGGGGVPPWPLALSSCSFRTAFGVPGRTSYFDRLVASFWRGGGAGSCGQHCGPPSDIAVAPLPLRFRRGRCIRDQHPDGGFKTAVRIFQRRGSPSRQVPLSTHLRWAHSLWVARGAPVVPQTTGISFADGLQQVERASASSW